MTSALNALRLQAFCCILSLAWGSSKDQQLAVLSAFAISVQLLFIWLAKQDLLTLWISFLDVLWPILEYSIPESIHFDTQSFHQVTGLLFWEWTVLSLSTFDARIVHELRWWDGVIFYNIAILPELAGVWTTRCVLAIGIAIYIRHLTETETKGDSDETEDFGNERNDEDVLCTHL